jgi:hypothetical protein
MVTLRQIESRAHIFRQHGNRICPWLWFSRAYFCVHYYQVLVSVKTCNKCTKSSNCYESYVEFHHLGLRASPLWGLKPQIHSREQVPTWRRNANFWASKISLKPYKSEILIILHHIYLGTCVAKWVYAFCSTQLSSQISSFTLKKCCHVGVHVILGT